MGKKKLFYMRGPGAQSFSIISLVHIWLIQPVVGCSEKFIKHFLLTDLALLCSPRGEGCCRKVREKPSPTQPCQTISTSFLPSHSLNSQIWTQKSIWTIPQKSDYVLPFFLLPWIHIHTDVESLILIEKNTSRIRCGRALQRRCPQPADLLWICLLPCAWRILIFHW